MKMSDLIKGTYITNEEASIMQKLNGESPLAGFSERDQVIIEGLIRKSLVSKIRSKEGIMVAKNEP